MIYGYARVSTDGQSVDTQVKHLRAANGGVSSAMRAESVTMTAPGSRSMLWHRQKLSRSAVAPP